MIKINSLTIEKNKKLEEIKEKQSALMEVVRNYTIARQTGNFDKALELQAQILKMKEEIKDYE